MSQIVNDVFSRYIIWKIKNKPKNPACIKKAILVYLGNDISIILSNSGYGDEDEDEYKVVHNPRSIKFDPTALTDPLYDVTQHDEFSYSGDHIISNSSTVYYYEPPKVEHAWIYSALFYMMSFFSSINKVYVGRCSANDYMIMLIHDWTKPIICFTKNKLYSLNREGNYSFANVNINRPHFRPDYIFPSTKLDPNWFDLHVCFTRPRQIVELDFRKIFDPEDAIKMNAQKILDVMQRPVSQSFDMFHGFEDITIVAHDDWLTEN